MAAGAPAKAMRKRCLDYADRKQRRSRLYFRLSIKLSSTFWHRRPYERFRVLGLAQTRDRAPLPTPHFHFLDRQ